MIDYFSERITLRLFAEGLIGTHDIAMKKYGLEILFGRIVSIGLSVLVSIFVGDFLSGIVYVSAFILLRRKTGGYHAPSHLTCLLSFLSLHLVNQLVIPLICINRNFIAHAMLLAAALLVFILAPIIHPDSILSPKDAIQLKSASRVAVIFLSILMYGFHLTGQEALFYSGAFGMLSSASLLGVAKIKKQEVRYEQQSK